MHIKGILLLVGIAFFIFIIWMNVTKGHFQTSCGCGASYMTNAEYQMEQKNLCPYVGACIKTIHSYTIDPLLLMLADLDLNK